MAASYVGIDPDGDTLIILPHPTDPYLGDEVLPAPAEDDQPSVAEETEMHPIVESLFKVSMKHLTMASRRAKAMFAGNYVEAQPQATGLRHWKFEPIFDPCAFEIVMDAIHGHTQKLPKTVTIETLAGIAAVVDDLDCHHALCFFADIWIGHLGASVPDKICDDLPRWILISFLFDKPGLFESATRVAILEGKNHFSPAGLPIRPKIIEMIDAERENLLELLAVQLYSLVQRISQDEVTCQLECKSVVIGTLVHQMMSRKIFLLPPCRPFVDLSLSAVTGMIREFQLPGLYTYPSANGRDCIPSGTWLVYRQDSVFSAAKKTAKDWGGIEIPMPIKKKGKLSMLGNCSKKHNCHLQDLIESEIENLQTEIKGLNLAEFV